MNIYATGILISIIVYLAVGNYAGRKVKHLEDYFVAGRKAPTLLIVGTLVASFMSTNAFLGETGMAYSGYGPLLIIATAVNSLGYIVGALFFGRFLRRSQALTVAEFFGRRFDSRRVQVVAGVTIVIGLGAYLMAVTQGAALIVEQVTGIPYGTALFMVWAGYTLFTFYAGSQGVVITDTMMFLLFSVVAFVALAYIIAAAGGWDAAVNSLANHTEKPGIISWHGFNGPDALWKTPAESLTWALIVGVMWAVVVAVSPWQASRYLMAKSEHVVVRSACASAAAIMILWVVLMAAGAVVNLSNPGIDPQESTMLWAAMNLMPPIAGTILMAGIMAAALSSASTFLSLVGFSVSHDLISHDERDDKRSLQLSRYTMLVVGLVVLLLAFVSPTEIFWISYFAGSVFASSWGPVAFMSVWSKRITSAAAFWGIVSGFLGNAVPKALDTMGFVELPVYLDPILIGGALSLIVILAVMRLSSPTEAEVEFRKALHIPPDHEFERREVKQSLLWPKLIIATGVLVSTLMMFLYVRPYQAAFTAGGGSIAAGEGMLALACGLTLITTGTLAWWGLKKFYVRPYHNTPSASASATSEPSATR